MKTQKTNIQLSQYKHDDYEEFKKLMQLCYNYIGGEFCSKEEMTLLSDLYPEGQIVAHVNGVLIGAHLSRIVPYEKYNKAHTQGQISNMSDYVEDYIDGNALYGLDMFVHPDYRRLNVANILYKSYFDEVSDRNFTNLIGVSLICNYGTFKNEMSLHTYIHKVKCREVKDNVLSFHLIHNAKVLDAMDNYLPSNEHQNIGYAAVIGFENLNFNPNLPIYKERKNSKMLAYA